VRSVQRVARQADIAQQVVVELHDVAPVALAPVPAADGVAECRSGRGGTARQAGAGIRG
jgi:hypothetical protein